MCGSPTLQKLAKFSTWLTRVSFPAATARCRTASGGPTSGKPQVIQPNINDKNPNQTSMTVCRVRTVSGWAQAVPLALAWPTKQRCPHETNVTNCLVISIGETDLAPLPSDRWKIIQQLCASWNTTSSQNQTVLRLNHIIRKVIASRSITPAVPAKGRMGTKTLLPLAFVSSLAKWEVWQTSFQHTFFLYGFAFRCCTTFGHCVIKSKFKNTSVETHIRIMRLARQPITSFELPLIFETWTCAPKFLKFGPPAPFALFSPLLRFLGFSSSSCFLPSNTKTKGLSERTESPSKVWWLTISLTWPGYTTLYHVSGPTWTTKKSVQYITSYLNFFLWLYKFILSLNSYTAPTSPASSSCRIKSLSFVGLSAAGNEVRWAGSCLPSTMNTVSMLTAKLNQRPFASWETSVASWAQVLNNQHVKNGYQYTWWIFVQLYLNQLWLNLYLLEFLHGSFYKAGCSRQASAASRHSPLPKENLGWHEMEDGPTKSG